MYKKTVFYLLLILIFIVTLSFSEDYLTLESLKPLLIKSPLYKIYQVQYNNALQEYNLAYSNLKPQLSLQFSYNQGETSVTLNNVTSMSETKSGNLSLSFSQVLFLKGQAGISIKLAELNLEQEKNNFKTNCQNLYYQFIQSFYNLYLAQEQLKIYEESYNLSKKQEEVAEKQFKDGVINEITLLDYKQKAKLAEINYNSAKNNLELSYKSLENLLGTTLPRVPVKLDVNYEPITYSADELISRLYSNNLTIKNSTLDLEKAKVNLEKANLPSWNIGISGSYSSGNITYALSFDTQNYALNASVSPSWSTSQKSTENIWNFKISFSTPILDGGSKNITKSQAQISLDQAQINYEKTKKDVELNFWKTYYNLLTAQETIEQKKLLLEQKKTNLEAQKIRYNLGLITDLDLKNYEIDYMQAQYDLKNAILNFNLQKIQLDILLGNWEVN
ncbi:MULTISPECIES: TolC family protein [Dictyoglomus]|jgi:outer membrane protein|uniref:Outer membrane efflux protein n=1 Tax=Dictyoglomus turgidum (strain DSM 6724 / Z-1310) TaxID=515635 RepID=B8E034_DICTD|nr:MULTISPECIES: TolC family protein [Dictyoglomus]ACK42117.1 outer membrane efflux protein [Dictyoglomus turgidum DSM 6724]HBU32348.1 TolC family protein [Dictyoglomus sp.]